MMLIMKKMKSLVYPRVCKQFPAPDVLEHRLVLKVIKSLDIITLISRDHI